MNAVRGAIVVVVALIIGVVVLARGLDEPETANQPTTTTTTTTTSSTVAEPPPAPDPVPAPSPDPPPATVVEPTPPPIDDDIPPPPPPPVVATHNRNEVRVLVANGTSICGAAGRVATVLSAEGYTVLPSVNADTAVDVSTVYYVPEYDADAAVVASLIQVNSSRILALPASPPTAPGDSDVLIHIGEDDLAQPNC